MRTLSLLAAFVAGLLLSVERCEAYATSALITQSKVRQLSTLFELYHQDTGKFPSTAANFAELDRYLDAQRGEKMSTDSWGRKLVYVAPGTHGDFDLYSLGANGIDEHGDGDDISNWAGIREGYYHKKLWPAGRLLLKLSIPLALFCLVAGFFTSWRPALPVAGVAFFGSLIVGSYLLDMTPLEENDFGAVLGFLAFLAVVCGMFIHAFRLRKQLHQ